MKARDRVLIAGLLVAGLGGVAGRSASAAIDPKFTPVQVVKQASLVLELEFTTLKGPKGEVVVKRVMKGKLDARTITLVFSTCAVQNHVELLQNAVNARPRTQAAFFVGKFHKDEDAEAPGAPAPGEAPPPEKKDQGPEQKGYLFANGTWSVFYQGKDGSWGMDGTDTTMLATWQGGTDMLLRAVDYTLSDPDAYLPAKEGVYWAEAKQFGKVDGKVHAAMPVDLAGDGKWALFVASDRGDRLFEYDAKADTLKDTTEAYKLTTKSRAAAWADFNGDGRLDLISCAGDEIKVYYQEADGTFPPASKPEISQFPGERLYFSVLDSEVPHHPGVIISTTEFRALYIPATSGNMTVLSSKLPAGEPLGEAAPCVVADLDGDHVPDVLQVFSKGSLLYRGKAPGQFAPPERCAIAAGEGAPGVFLGDFDGDGLLDVFTVSGEAGRVWQNDGNRDFTETLALCGEAGQKVVPGAIAGVTGDFNNDGRQDFVLFYGEAFPRSFFNRGFRSFGFTNSMDIGTNGLLPAAGDGQQAGTLCDFTGDGAQDLVMILKDGSAWILPRQKANRPTLCVRGDLATGGARVGPLTVTGYRGGRCLGAWNVVAGTTEAFVGIDFPGPMTLKWEPPAGKPGQKDVNVENRPVRFVISY